MVNIALVVTSETSPGARAWLAYRDVLHLLDMICCCAILLPIVWSIRHLREVAEQDDKGTGPAVAVESVRQTCAAQRNLERLTRFRQFYLLVVTYIYVTRIVAFLLEATLPFEKTW
jgi:hypothetical protein